MAEGDTEAPARREAVSCGDAEAAGDTLDRGVEDAQGERRADPEPAAEDETVAAGAVGVERVVKE